VIDGPSRLAAVIRRPQVAATPPGSSHAAAGADQPTGAIPARRQGVGPAAADLQQGGPESGAFGEGIGKTFSNTPATAKASAWQSTQG